MHDNTRERLKVYNTLHTGAGKRHLVVWTGDETETKNTSEDKQRKRYHVGEEEKTKAEMDGLCQSRHERCRDNRR